MKKYITSLVALALSASLYAEDISLQVANLTIAWSDQYKSFTIRGQQADGTTRSIATRSKPKATYDNAAGVSRDYFTTDRYATMAYTTEAVSDEFGRGTAHRFTFTDPDADQGDKVSMQFSVFEYPGHPFVLTQLALISQGGPIRSNHLEPISTTVQWRMMNESDDNRMLKVPFDNDGFGRYHTYRLTTGMTSYEVGSIFDGANGFGAVYGSIDHDHWKSGICVDATGNASIKSLQLISGMSDTETRDNQPDYGHLPHGKLVGDTIRSARFLVGFFDDWRVGMETFADACATVRPAMSNWTAGTPFGWQSWGVLAEKNSYEANIEISDYYAQVLQPGGFINSKGNIVMSLDASDGHSEAQKKDFIAHAKANGQMVGCYTTPFSLWWDENSINTYTISWNKDGERVTGVMRDAVLKINGKPIKYDGAYCADPTHPVTKQSIVNFVRSEAAKGTKWIKADFLNCGIIQADSYYKDGITTAVEAYNDGMRYLQQQCEQYGIFVALSIAPLFPHGYANSRRVACDTWGRIDQTEYCMNAISGGWWTDRLYQYNDPDHLVLVGNGDQYYSLSKGMVSEGENRARFTSGAVTGMMLVADNFSPNDKSGRGNNTLSRKRAELVMLNADINRMADLGRSFRPLYGHKEYDGQHDHAQSLFTHQADSFIYVAAFNYTNRATSYNIPLADLGLAQDEVLSEVKELWTGSPMSIANSQLSISVPAKDVSVVRLCLLHPESDAVTFPQVSASHVIRAEQFDMQGRRLPDDSLYRGLTIRQVTYADGTVDSHKFLIR
ncbi:MAG: hypothetical protein IJ209_04980 [Bacteroidaceae bacterium]|nr:hypothetical protein [Bacteroidaceae bacterium]